MSSPLHERVVARLGRPLRRVRRRISGLRRRLRKRLARSSWLRDTRLAFPMTGPRLALGLYFDDVERLLHALARDSREVTFIQVGACEGSSGDPIGWFLRKRPWRGVLVEPVPYLFDRVRRNTAGLAGVILENAAIAPHQGEQVFHYLEPGEDDPRPELYKMIGSLVRENLERHQEFIRDLDERIISKPLTCLPLDALCRKHGLDDLDLLFCDAEGYDFEVLKTLDFARTPPRLVIWERRHLGPDAEACRRHLEAYGYRVLDLGGDGAALRLEGAGPALSRAFERLG